MALRRGLRNPCVQVAPSSTPPVIPISISRMIFIGDMRVRYFLQILGRPCKVTPSLYWPATEAMGSGSMFSSSGSSERSNLGLDFPPCSVRYLNSMLLGSMHVRREQGFSVSLEEGLVGLSRDASSFKLWAGRYEDTASSIPSNHGSSFFASPDKDGSFLQ